MASCLNIGTESCLLHSLAKLINALDEANAHIFFPVEHCLIHISGPVAFRDSALTQESLPCMLLNLLGPTTGIT